LSRKKNKQRAEDAAMKKTFPYQQRNPLPPIQPRNENQKKYNHNLQTYQVNVAQGAAGVGKTFIVAAKAADAFMKGDIDKIIVARPYVQTGKSSGAKPGSVYDKLYPYVRPILDTIRERMGDGKYKNHLKDGVHGEIEVCELESIRGRSFDERCWLIVDECQQATAKELIAILTRIGTDCRVTLCGDIKQNDLKERSGLEWLLNHVSVHNIDIGITTFTSDDIVRSGFVKDFVKSLEDSNSIYY